MSSSLWCLVNASLKRRHSHCRKRPHLSSRESPTLPSHIALLDLRALRNTFTPRNLGDGCASGIRLVFLLSSGSGFGESLWAAPSLWPRASFAGRAPHRQDGDIIPAVTASVLTPCSVEPWLSWGLISRTCVAASQHKRVTKSCVTF